MFTYLPYLTILAVPQPRRITTPSPSFHWIGFQNWIFRTAPWICLEIKLFAILCSSFFSAFPHSGLDLSSSNDKQQKKTWIRVGYIYILGL
jgi:hypothetical protein